MGDKPGQYLQTQVESSFILPDLDNLELKATEMTVALCRFLLLFVQAMLVKHGETTSNSKC